MVSRTALPHAFTRDSNPKRDSPLDEELAEKTVSIRLYAADWELIQDSKNRSDIVRDAVRKHLRGIEPST
jgi:hypothetical protein